MDDSFNLLFPDDDDILMSLEFPSFDINDDSFYENSTVTSDERATSTVPGNLPNNGQKVSQCKIQVMHLFKNLAIVMISDFQWFLIVT